MAKNLLITTVLLTTVLAASAVQAHVGAAQTGSNVHDNGDEYLMCGKCTWDAYQSTSANSAGTITDGTAYYKLVCNHAAVNSSQWAVLHYRCSQGCATCLQETNIEIGAKIDAAYSVLSLATPYVAASAGCCPVIVEHTHWGDDACSTTSKSSYSPAGCSANTGTKSYSRFECDDADEAPDKWYVDCSAGANLNNADDCPANPSCTSSFGLSNFPCLKLDHQSHSAYAKQTYKCRKDATQTCLRAVRQIDYTSAMTTGTSGDIANLQTKCEETHAGGSSHAVAAVLALAVSMVLAVL